ncbi:MAG: ParB N-terminal domain-containing protein [Pseudomonadota bacterium]
MLKKISVRIEDVYVPTKRRKMLDAERVLALAEDVLVNSQKTPIRIRKDGDRFVLLEGLHRLEALRSLGEETIDGYLVQGRLH